MKWKDFKDSITTRFNHNHDCIVRIRDIQLRGSPVPRKSFETMEIPLKMGNTVVSKATRQGIRSLLERLGVPFSFFNKCSPHLASEVLKEFLAAQQSKSVLIRTECASPGRGDHLLRFVGSPKYDIYNDIQVITALDNFVSQDTIVKHIYRDFDRTTFMIPLSTQPLKVLREFQLGMRVTNSETGCSSFRIELFLLELVCTNGMVLPKKAFPTLVQTHLLQNEKHNIKAFMDMLLPQISALSDHIKCVMGHLVDIPADYVLNRLQNEKRLTASVLSSIETALPNYGKTALDVVSAITEVARDIENIDMKDHLQTLAGEITFA